MELAELLKEAQREIQQLRRRNELLSAQVKTTDSFMRVLRTKPAEHLQAMSEDIVWQLFKKIAEIEAAELAAAKPANKQPAKRLCTLNQSLPPRIESSPATAKT